MQEFHSWTLHHNLKYSNDEYRGSKAPFHPYNGMWRRSNPFVFKPDFSYCVCRRVTHHIHLGNQVIYKSDLALFFKMRGELPWKGGKADLDQVQGAAADLNPSPMPFSPLPSSKRNPWLPTAAINSCGYLYCTHPPELGSEDLTATQQWLSPLEPFLQTTLKVRKLFANIWPQFTSLWFQITAFFCLKNQSGWGCSFAYGT